MATCESHWLVYGLGVAVAPWDLVVGLEADGAVSLGWFDGIDVDGG